MPNVARIDSAATVTIQVAADIQGDIDSGVIAPDTRLPTEMELSEQYVYHV